MQNYSIQSHNIELLNHCLNKNGQNVLGEIDLLINSDFIDKVCN
jgi:hypothetical protein